MYRSIHVDIQEFVYCTIFSDLQEAMCARHKADPNLLPKLPLFSPDGELLTNGITSPHHMIPSCDGESSDSVMRVTREELDHAVAMTAEQAIVLSTLDSKHLCVDLIKKSQIDLERIDQQLLELGPYAQDAYDDEPQVESVPPVALVSPPPPDVRRGKKGRQAMAHKPSRRFSRGLDDFSEPQRGSWRSVGGGWGEVSNRRPSDDKELPKKKWRKVGSAGPTVRGKEGQLDAQSDPLNVSTANIIITPASDLEMRGLYQPPPQAGKQRSTQSVDGDQVGEGVSSPVQGVHTQGRVSSAHGHRPSELPGFSVSTTAHATPSCNTTSPSDMPGHARTQPTAYWKATSGGTPHGAHHDHPHPLQEGYNAQHKHARLPQQVRMDSSSEEVDVTKIEGEDESLKVQPVSVLDVRRQDDLISPPQERRGSHGSYHSDLKQTQSPSPKPNQLPAAPYQHQPDSGVPKPPGFSISHLAKGLDQLSDMPHPPYVEHQRAQLNISDQHGVASPHSDVDVNVQRRRTSSSSSHRSTRQPSIDDNTLARSASPLSTSHPRGQFVPGMFGGTAVLSPNATKDKLQAVGGTESKIPCMVPFSMWPPGMPVPTEAAQIQRYPLSAPFLAASNPWLRGGMIPGLPFRPALYPTGTATNTLDPTNPYKSMLGLPLYPFAPAAGLKGPFPTPTFSGPSSASNSQPQTPSTTTPGFSFSQYPVPPGLSASALREVQNRLASGGTAQLVQHPSLSSVGSEGKQRGSPETGQEAPQPWPILPGMSLLQTPFGFGVQNPLSSTVSQASQINLLAQRGSVPFSTSPLTLASQSVGAGGSTGGDVQQSVLEVYHHQPAVGGGGGRRSKKQSGAAIDLTGREQTIKHIEAPSPQEAVKMATQRISPFQDPSRFSPKLKSVHESVPPSSSPLVPAFVTNPNTLSTQAPGPILSYPVLNTAGGVPAHLINPSQLMGVALSGSHMIPVNYPGVLQNASGKTEEGGGGKKRSPKRGGSAQKLRIHQMDFKQQQGKIDRRRKRPWKPQEKQHVEASLVKSAVGTQPRAVSEPQPPSSTRQDSGVEEDNYALNMLADCSSKEGEKGKISAASPPRQTQELDAKRALMRSPGCIAGANSLLLLAKPDSVTSTSSGATRSHDSPPENAVVDGLLRLSNSPIPSSSASQEQPNSGQDISESTRSDAAEAILMMSHGVPASGGETIGAKKPGSLRLSPPLGSEVSESKEREEVDSEKTDTDSEATLSPTTPVPTFTAAGAAKTLHSPLKISETTNSSAAQENHISPTRSPASATTKTTTVISPLPPAAWSEEESTYSDKQGGDVAEAQDPHSEQETTVTVPVMPGKLSEMETNEDRELLGLGPQPSSRLQVIEEDEEDGDIDVENVDSSPLGDFSLSLDEPDEPVFNSPSKSQVESEFQPTVMPPEIVPPSPPGESASLTPPTHLQPSLSYRECEEDRVTDEDEVLQDGIPPAPAEVGETDTPPSPKRFKLEESVKEANKEEEDESKSDALAEHRLGEMDTETEQRLSAVETKSVSLSPGPTHSPSPPLVNDDRPLELTNEDEVKFEEDGESGNTQLCSGPEDHSVEPLLPADDDKSQEVTTANSKTSSDDESQPSEADISKSTINPDLPSVTASVIFTETSEGVTAQTSEQKEQQIEANHNEVTASPSASPHACLSWPSEPEEMVPSEMRSSPVKTDMSSSAPLQAESTLAATDNCSEDEQPKSSPPPETPSQSVSSNAVDVADTRTVVETTTEQKIPNNAAHDDGSLSLCSLDRKSTVCLVDKSAKKADSSGGLTKATADVIRRISPPAPVVQNRLPVGKSRFDRHQQNRKLLSAQHTHKHHSRDEKSSMSKKWSNSGSRGRGLFDVDPREGGQRQKTENKSSELFKHLPLEGRKVKPHPPPPIHGHSNKMITERLKHNSRPPRGPEDPPHWHGRSQDGHQGGVWDHKEASIKQKVHSRSRQGPRYSPSSSEHSSGGGGGGSDYLKDRDDGISDEDQLQNRGGGGARGRGAMGGHQNSHGWRDDWQSPMDHTRERGHLPSKHKGHRTDFKPGFEQGRKIIRVEKEVRKHVSMAEANNDERGAAAFKRHRGDDDSDHTPSLMRLKHGATRKRSYESVSDDDLLEETNRHSSRESSLVAEDRGGTRGEHRLSQETVGSSVWRKELKRLPDGSEDVDDFSRTSKHKKHKHDSKERRRWRKPTDGGDLKLKRTSDDKSWLGYHKH